MENYPVLDEEFLKKDLESKEPLEAKWIDGEVYLLRRGETFDPRAHRKLLAEKLVESMGGSEEECFKREEVVLKKGEVWRRMPFEISPLMKSLRGEETLRYLKFVPSTASGCPTDIDPVGEALIIIKGQPLVPNQIPATFVDGRTCLHRACMDGDDEAVRYYIVHQSEVNAQDNMGFTPLHFAAYKQNAEVVRLLIEAEADLNLKDVEGSTPLLYHAANGRVETTKLLVEASADINIQNEVGLSPLGAAIYYRRNEIASYLIECGAEVKTTSMEKPLIFLAFRFSNFEGMRLLLDNGADMNAKDKQGNSLLAEAARCGDIRSVKFLREKGMDIEDANNSGITPLMLAAIMNRNAVAEYLIKKGANIEAESELKETALFFSICLDTTDSLTLLITAGASISKKNKFSETVLHRAIALHNPSAVKILLEAGADPNSPGFLGRQPLAYLEKDDPEIVDLLINAKVKINIKDKLGFTALDELQRNELKTVCDLVSDRGGMLAKEINPAFKGAPELSAKPLWKYHLAKQQQDEERWMKKKINSFNIPVPVLPPDSAFQVEDDVLPPF